MLQVRARRDAGKVRKSDRTIHLGVDNEPRLMELHVVERDAERLAHETVGTVAGDDMTRGDALCAAHALHRQRHAVIGLLQRAERHAASQRHMRKARQSRLQRAFELGLEEEIVVRPAEALAQADRAEIADHAAVGADVDVPLCLAHQRPHGFREPDRLEEAHHLVVDMDRAGQWIRFGLAFDHQRAQARMAKQIRRERADRAASNNRDLVFHVRTAHVRKPSSLKRNSCWMRPSRAVCGLVTPHWSLRPGGNFQKSGPRGTYESSICSTSLVYSSGISSGPAKYANTLLPGPCRPTPHSIG